MLNNQVVFVTGGAGFLGKSLCEAIAKGGGIPVVADLSAKHAADCAEKIKKQGFKAISVGVDITKADSLKAAILEVEKQGHSISAVVNNAYPRNAHFNRDFFKVEYQDFCENLGLHLGGYFLTSQTFAQYFLDQKKPGNIVNIASIYGVSAPTFEIYAGTDMQSGPEYAAIKSGVIHLTKYMASRFKGMNIRVNCISPGGLLDDQPAPFLAAYRKKCAEKGMLDPKDIAGTLIYLLSDQSQYVRGQNIVVDDGFLL